MTHILGLCVGCSDFQSPIYARILKPYCQLKAKDRQGMCVVYTERLIYSDLHKIA